MKPLTPIIELCTSYRYKKIFNELFIILIIFICSTVGQIERNVARNKEVNFCLSQSLSIVTDGDRLRAETITGSCYPTAYLDVLLLEDFYIHYVVVYIPAASRVSSDYGKLDYFIVDQFQFRTMVRCSEFPSRSTEAIASVGMVVNCKSHPPTNKIRMESRKDEGMVLSEIEVYTLGQENNDVMIHLGCFEIFAGIQKNSSNIYQCFSLCKFTNFYLAIKNKTECFCSDSYNIGAEVEALECTYKCTGFERSCGGPNRFSVYIATLNLPHYVGCYNIIRPSEIRTILEENVNPGKCIKHCDDTNYAIVWEGRKCGCLNRLEPILNFTDYDDCNVFCATHRNKICGGNAEASVYKTCFTHRINPLKCSELFHCDEWDESGICLTSCESDYVGSHCLARPFTRIDCRTVTNLCVDFPHTECVMTEDSYECKCMEGYVRNATGFCVETNICVTANPCLDKPNTVCVTQPTGYSCDCIEGYVINEDGVCEENQCLSNPCANMTNVVCVTSPGTYSCDCMTGYFRNETTGPCIADGCHMDPCLRDPFTNCVRVNDTYSCECIEGYFRDRGICVADPCFDNPCADIMNTVCEKLPYEGYECKCVDGFYKDDDGVCQIDPCYLNPCNVNETFTVCVIQLDSFICVCMQGYYRNNMNECSVDHCYGNPCFNQTSTLCEMTNDTYECTCIERFYKDENGVCIEDFCLDDPCGNETHVVCESRPGTFRCVCEEGYSRDLAGDCVGLDECLTDDNPCINNTFSVCVKNDSIYYCKCLEGFDAEDGGYCEDINECKLDFCDEKSTICENTNGSYECECKVGHVRKTFTTCKRDRPKTWYSDNYFSRLTFFIMIPLVSLFLICLFTSLSSGPIYSEGE